uniref:Putative fumarylacetoacetate hydrolase n=1 Tax=Paecilomyces divaricatus TaxID=644132 RepID=A0A3G1IHJ0_PAEDI|nr:putative fumarylacetoacetate hydrolase [Paecilomyces divaricatus]
MGYLENLPAELLFLIVDQLDRYDLMNLRVVHRRFSFVNPRVFKVMRFYNEPTVPVKLRKLLKREDMRSALDEIIFSTDSLFRGYNRHDAALRLKRVARLLANHDDVNIKTVHLVGDSGGLGLLLRYFAEAGIRSLRYLSGAIIFRHHEINEEWLPHLMDESGVLEVLGGLERLDLTLNNRSGFISHPRGFSPHDFPNIYSIMAATPSLTELLLKGIEGQDFSDMLGCFMFFRRRSAFPPRLRKVTVERCHTPLSFLTRIINHPSIEDVTLSSVSLILDRSEGIDARRYYIRKWQDFLEAFSDIYYDGEETRKRLTVGELWERGNLATIDVNHLLGVTLLDPN